MAAGQAEEEQGTTTKSALAMAAQVVAPSAILVSLLFYFGWVRTNAIFIYFGVDQRLLAYGREDYLIRSAYVAFRPTVALLLAVAVAFVGYLSLQAGLSRLPGQGRAAVLVLLGVAGLVALCIGASQALSLWLPRPTPAIGAFLLGAGAAALEGVASLAGWDEWALGRRLIFAAIVIVSLFWSFAISAQSSGERLARAWGDQPSSRPAITVVSRVDLGLFGPGVKVEQVPVASTGAGGATPWYRYTGLRLLIYSNERWFLIPEQWGKDGDRRAFVLRDSADVRIETAP